MRALHTVQKVVGNYQVQEELARGAMGVVYRGYDPALNRSVAIKVLLTQVATPEDLARFKIEAQATARLRHPHIVGIQSAGAVGVKPYIVMDLIEGGSLKDLLKKGPLPGGRAADMIEKLARGLDYAHSQGVLHRDIKPHNIMIDAKGDPLLTDFGLAKLLDRDTRITMTGEIHGTPVYMPPEQAMGETEKIGPASDLYSLGATFYELLTGRAPFTGRTVVAVLEEVITVDPAPPSTVRDGVDPAYDAICLRCLAKEPADRFESAAALAEALAELKRTPPPTEEAPHSFTGLLIGLSAGCLLAVGALALGHTRVADLEAKLAAHAAPPTDDPRPEPPKATEPDALQRAKAAFEEFDYGVAIEHADAFLEEKGGLDVGALLLRARARSRLDLANRKIQDDLLLALEQDAAHGQATLLLTRHLTERAKEEGEEQLLTEVVDRLEKLAQATNGAVALAARCDLAVAYQLRHMDTEANESLECLEAERPTPGSVHLARAEVYELQEEFDKADEELILAIAASPASIRAHVARARLWSDGSNCSRAFYHWARAYDLGLRTWELHDNLAREARSTRDWRLAIDHASRALAIRRDLIASLWARGKARNRLGLYEESIEDLNAFLGLEPNGKRAKEAEGLIAAAQLAGSR